MPNIDAKKIGELRGLLAKAAPEPWTAIIEGRGRAHVRDVGGLIAQCPTVTRFEGQDIRFENECNERAANAALIAAMRNSMPALLDLAASSLTRGGEGDGALDRIFSDPRLDRCRRHLSGSDIMIMIRHARETMWKPIASMPTGEDDSDAE